MAGQPDGDDQAEHVPVTTEELERELEGIKRRLADAIRKHDGKVDADAAIAVLQRQMWNELALLHQHMGDSRPCKKCGSAVRVDSLSESAKASREAVRQGELAVKLSKATLADRVLVLEQLVAAGERKGRGISEESRKRREG